MSDEVAALIDDVMLQLSQEIDALIAERIRLIADICTPADIANFRCQIAITDCFGTIGYLAANAHPDMADALVDDWLAALPRMLAAGRDRAVMIGREVRNHDLELATADRSPSSTTH